MKTNAYMLDAFYASYAKTKAVIEHCGSPYRRKYVEESIAYEESRLLNDSTISPTSQLISLGALAAYKEWIAEDDRTSAELDAMYADYCEETGEEYIATV